VLVVGDERLAQPWCRALARSRHVVVVGDAAEALARIAGDERYDIVLCELALPVLDGIEFHRLLCERAPELVDRVVFVTTGPLTARVQAFFERVPNLLLRMPVDLDGLRSRGEKPWRTPWR
jgi:CheY-like chemotaxis protein